MDTQTLQNITYYQEYLMGQRSQLKEEMKKKTTIEKFSLAKNLIRYAFTELLGWTPEEAIAHATKELYDQLKLTNYVKNHYIFPIDLVEGVDWDYVTAIAFGYPMDYKKQLLKHRYLIKAGVEKRYRKNLFAGNYGRKRAAYLLQDVIASSVSLPDGPGSDTEKLYKRFAASGKMTVLLKKEGLETVLVTLYNSPLEYLHYSLPKEEKDDFLYALYTFDSIFTKEMKENKHA